MSAPTSPRPVLARRRPPEIGSRGALWRRWVLLVSAGEAAGFLVPVGVVLAGSGDLSGPAALTVLLAAGAAEGALLGSAQAAVLHRVLPGFSRRDWVLRTAAAAVLAWALGMAPSTWATGVIGWPVPVQALLSVAGAGGLLASIGVAQWTVLRRSVPRAGRWVAWTAAGWLAGLAVFTAVTAPLWQPGQSPALVAVIGLVGGGLMALSMAAVTGRGVLDLLSRGGGA